MITNVSKSFLKCQSSEAPILTYFLYWCICKSILHSKVMRSVVFKQDCSIWGWERNGKLNIAFKAVSNNKKAKRQSYNCLKIINKKFGTCCSADIIDNQRVKSFPTMQVQCVYAAVQFLCYLLTRTEFRRYNVFKTVKNRCKIVKKALVIHTDPLGTGQRVTISSSNPRTAITCSFWSLLFWSLFELVT